MQKLMQTLFSFPQTGIITSKDRVEEIIEVEMPIIKGKLSVPLPSSYSKTKTNEVTSSGKTSSGAGGGVGTPSSKGKEGDGLKEQGRIELEYEILPQGQWMGGGCPEKGM